MKKVRTKTERVIRFLTEGLKFKEAKSGSKKYRLFVKDDFKYYVGKAGAVRTGKTLSNSISITTSVHNNMLLWEKMEL